MPAANREKLSEKMELKLAFDRFVQFMNWDKEAVLHEAYYHKKRGPATWRITAADAKLKNEFGKLFGFDFEEIKENIDLLHWKRNVKSLCAGKDVNLGSVGSSPVKRKRRSLNESLNESLLASFEESATVDDSDEITRLRAENKMLRNKLKSCQEIFVKEKVATPRSRNGGGSVLQYSVKTRALAISLLSQGETAVGVHRMLKTMALITPELLEGGDNVGIPCVMTLSRWRDAIPGLNSLQSISFIENDEKFVLG